VCLPCLLPFHHAGAPYTNTWSSTGTLTFSKGIWKSIYLVATGSAFLTYVVPQVWYRGAYPTAPLPDAANGPWEVAVTVHFSTPAATSGQLRVVGSWAADAAVTQPLALPPGASSANVTLSARDVPLWWPNELGAQRLFAITATFTPAAGGLPAVASAPRRVGFRAFALVTADDSDPSRLVGLDGSGNLTMRFRVNGANVWARGGNMIPTEELEGRLNATTFRVMVASAAAAHMNVFRVWGGGIWYPTAFYDACDAAGIMLYHDIQYAQGHAPNATATQEAEIRHQLRRTANAPAFVAASTCNECGETRDTLYATFVAPLLVAETPARVPWPSCPSAGWEAGVSTLWGLPNGAPAGLLPRALRPPSAGDAEPVTTALPCASGNNCTLQADADFATGSAGPHPPAQDAAECCDICTATPGCWVGVLAGTTCWLKPRNATIRYKPGVTAVWPTGHGPIPPLPPTPPQEIESHGPYQHGGGFPSMDGRSLPSLFNANLPPKLWPVQPLGTAEHAVFASEFGASVFPSFESLSPTLDPAHWGIQGGAEADTCEGGAGRNHCQGPNPMAQRNYPCNNVSAARCAANERHSCANTSVESRP